MPLTYEPRSEEYLAEEAEKRGAWTQGVYHFDVNDATNQTSKAGAPMIVVDISVFNDQGERKFLKDYLVAAMEFKLRHICETCGILDRYESGNLDASDFIGRSGRVKLGVEPKTDKYPAKNVVRDYDVDKSKRLSPSTALPNAPADHPANQDIPF